MKRYVTAMSIPKRIIENKLEEAAAPLTDHLVKLYLFPDSEYVNHWRQEVYGFLNSVAKLKSNNKLPTFQFIYNIVTGYLDQLDTAVEFMIEEYSNLTPKRTDVGDLRVLSDEYLAWLADQLSARGRVHSQEVYDKLQSLGL